MTLTDILFKRHYLLVRGKAKENSQLTSAYLAAYLLSNFGIEVDRPELLNEDTIEQVAEIMHLDIPHSFYSNPQDTKLYTCDELALEQLVSYFMIELTGNGAIDEANSEKYDRIAIFEKALPKYKVGNELKLRQFKIVLYSDTNTIDNILTSIMKAYCSYTRPLSLDETDEFLYLVEQGYLKENYHIACTETVFNLIDTLDISYARFLDKKDIVKYSVLKLSDKADFSNLTSAEKDVLNQIGKMATYVKDCPLSKKQAKFYNKLIKECKINQTKVSNNESPDKLALIKLNMGDVIGAAKTYAKNGSMLERHLKMLLSRANEVEAKEILNLLDAKNPVALYQLTSGLNTDLDGSRVFTFTKNNRIKIHTETEYETTWRKSRLSDSTKELLMNAVKDKFNSYYSGLDSLGKIYVNEELFNKIALPTNTSATGKGLDVLPVGSRIAIKGTAIRTFVRWKGIYDVDADINALKVDEKGNLVCNKYLNWSTYHSRPFGDAILFSGDDRSSDGAEYYDVRLQEVKDLGYQYLVFGFHGFGSPFNKGETICGYQDKTDLMTQAWDPKNIELQFNVKGDSTVCQAFAIDLNTNEIIILNQMVSSYAPVIYKDDYLTIAKYLNKNYLDISMLDVVKHRGELVTNPEEADVIFDDNYQAKENQQVIHSYDVEKLVSIINGNNLNQN